MSVLSFSVSSIRSSRRVNATRISSHEVTLCDALLLYASELELTSDLMKRNSGAVRLNCSRENVFSTCTSIASGHWRLECIERNRAGRHGMTFKLYERRGLNDLCILTVTSPGLSEVGANNPRWVIGRPQKGFFDSHFMRAVCTECGSSWLLNPDIRASSRIYGDDLTSQQSGFIYGFLTKILEFLARASLN